MDVPRPRPDGDRPRPVIDPAELERRPIDRRPQLATLASIDPVVVVPPEVLARFNARVLDPSTALKVAGQPQLGSTVYLADRLLVRGAVHEDLLSVLNAAAAPSNLTVTLPAAHAARREQLVAAAREMGADNADDLLPTVAVVSPIEDKAAQVDAWEVLQNYRASPDFDGGVQVGLDHLLTATRHVVWTPYGPPGLSAAGTASASYGQPGWGGRQPVTWLGPPPSRRDELGCRRPVVAILDSGVGEHAWLPLGPDSCVQRNVMLGQASLGLADPSAFETTGVVSDPLEGVLDTYSGHGTFIAGLVRQQCPDADILSIRVMPTDGAAPEHVVLEALTMLALRQDAAQRNGASGDVVDVVSLSLGYYPELIDSSGPRPFLLDAIEALGRSGVVVVASAGNDATARPMFPAAFTPYADGCVPAPDPGCAPVISVGAENPDGTVALFSNAGPWVVCTQPGAALVSTFPNFDGSGQAAFDVPGDVRRSTIDPDNFSSGFGLWSGTSFAAPVLAGKIAQSLVDGDCGPIDPVDPAAMLDRAWSAISQHTPVTRP